MFGIRLKELREERGLSQYGLAAAFGCPQSTIGGWESGARETNFSTLLKLADFFGVSIDYLLGRSENKGFSPQDRAAGISYTESIEISPLEDDLLSVFRELGVKRGESTQRLAIRLIEQLLDA